MKSHSQLYAAVDLETTGSRFSKGDRIFQVGISFLEGDQLVQDYSFLINPGRAIPPAVERLTGVKNKDVKQAPFFEDVADYIYGLLQDCIFVAHNIQFDYHFLNRSLQEVGLPPLTLKGMDTVELTKILYPTLASYRLSDLSRYFSLEHHKAHDAVGDAHATADLFRFLRKKAANLPLVTLDRLNELADSTMMDNRLFFATCLQEALEQKKPLPKGVIIRNGLALREKNAVQEQTAYREKEGQSLSLSAAEALLSGLGLAKRPLQLEMLTRIDNFMRKEERRNLLIEAPPGIGKTLAYAIPSLYWATPERKVVISTASLLLQNQLLDEELHTLQAALPFPFKVASLASRKHYLHLGKFSKLKQEELSGRDRLILMSLYVWLAETENGNLLDLSPSHKMTSLFEDISWQNEREIAAEWMQDDFFFHNVSKARQASVLVTNHGYLVHHMAELGEYSSEKPVLVVDEAHQLPDYFKDTRQNRFPFTLVARKFARFESDTSSYREYLEANATHPYPQYEMINLEFALERFQQILDEGMAVVTGYSFQEMYKWSKHKEEGQLFLPGEVFQRPRTKRFFDQSILACEEVLVSGKHLETSETISQESQFTERLSVFLSQVENWRDQLIQIRDSIATSWHTIDFRFLNNVLEGVFIQSAYDTGVDLQAELSSTFERVLYVSASLFVKKGDSFFPEKIADPDAEQVSLLQEHSSRKLHVLVPEDAIPIKYIDEDTLASQIVEAAVKLSEHTNKKMLVLLRSNSLLKKVHGLMREQEYIADSGIELLAQGFSGSTRRMQRRFLEAKKAILLASGMYWEGVDFPGDQLELLLIPRLPFDSPDSPESQAIHERHSNLGKNAFREVFLPRMLLRLKQGMGRLARGEQQEGVVVCMDNRILHSPYARSIKDLLGEEVAFEELPYTKMFPMAKKYLQKSDD